MSELRDEVQLIVDALERNPAFSGATEHKAADLIKRLAQENAALVDENVWLQKTEAKVEGLEAKLALLDKNHYEHMQPYMICVPKEVWRKALQALQEDKE